MLRGIRLLLLSAVVVGCTANGPRDAKSQEAASIYTELGVSYMQENRPDIALSNLQRALELDPSSVDAHNAIAILYDRLNRPGEADRYYSRAVELAPENSQILNNFGVFLCNRGRYQEALKRFEQALENPVYRKAALAMTNAGNCLLKADRSAEAEGWYRKALKADPRFPVALARMAKVSHDKGNHLSTRAYLQRYRTVAPLDAELLLLGVITERTLGDLDTAASYALSLKNRFPDSEQADQLMQLEKNDTRNR